MSTLFDSYFEKYGDLLTALCNAGRHERLGHAFLISSSNRELRRGFAIVLAQLAGCSAVAAIGKPDGSCPYCLKLQKGTYPAFYELYPVGKKFQIRVGERENPEPNTVRNFIDRFNYTVSGDVRLKIGVIHDADRMNSEAQNALLKTLEEPPSDSLIILETGNPAALLPTTRSRCQQLNLPVSQVSYDFPGQDRLLNALNTCVLKRENALTVAEKAASELISVASNLSQAAENEVSEEMAADYKYADELNDKVYQKQLDERKEALITGRYMLKRREFLSFISVFCSQVFMISSKVSYSGMANPELLPPGDILEKVSAERGAFLLKESEELLRTLAFPVNEELALRCFAVSCVCGDDKVE